jgi:hypothetical protein
MPLAGATVELLGAVAQTAADGSFSLEVSGNGRAVLKAALAGYFAQYVPVAATTPRAWAEVTLISKGAAIALANAQAGGTVTADGAQLVVPGGALRNGAGQAYSGTANVRLRRLAPGASSFAEAMPGRFEGRNAASVDGVLTSFGFVALELTDPAGAPLSLAQPASVRIPVATAPTAATRQWRFDAAAGRWVDAGPVQVVSPGVVQMSVTTAGEFWNCDDWDAVGTVRGRVTDCSGAAATGAKIEVVNGPNRLVGFSAADGTFAIDVPAGFTFGVGATVEGSPSVPAERAGTVAAGASFDAGEFRVACVFEGPIVGAQTATYPALPCTIREGFDGRLVAVVESLSSATITGALSFVGSFVDTEISNPDDIESCRSGTEATAFPVCTAAGANGAVGCSVPSDGWELSAGRIAAGGQSMTLHLRITQPEWAGPLERDLVLTRR